MMALLYTVEVKGGEWTGEGVVGRISEWQTVAECVDYRTARGAADAYETFGRVLRIRRGNELIDQWPMDRSQ